MNASTQQQIKRLFRLVEISQELGDLVDLKLVDQWCLIREEHGLALTLQLIKEYATETATPSQPSQTTNPNQNQTLVQ
jgi:hypothetical protein